MIPTTPSGQDASGGPISCRPRPTIPRSRSGAPPVRSSCSAVPSRPTVSPTPLEVRLDDESVVIGRGGRPLATVRDDAVALDIPPLALRLAANEERLTLTCGTATITVASGSIELSDGATSVTVTAEQVTVTGTTIDLSTAAGRVQLTPATVSINNGALEVI